MMTDDFSAAHFRSKIEEFFAEAADGWPTWAFSNHDVPRHVSRWRKHAATPDALAKLSAALLLSLEGSICVYQGEELGQLDTDLEYHELDDPQGKRFWPDNKGRDGCRTPMVWDAGEPNAGFSEPRPWLPVKAPQAARHVAGQVGRPDSVLEFYRRMLRLRRENPALRTGRTTFFDTSEPVLAFARGGEILCVFNLSPETHAVRLQGAGAVAIAEGAEHRDGTLVLHPNGFALMAVEGMPAVEDAPKPARRAAIGQGAVGAL
jgi:alpha-glucosidase